MKQMNKKKQKKIKWQKVKYPIGFKLVMIFSVLVIFALGINAAVIVHLFTMSERSKAIDNNFTINQRTADSIQTDFMSVQSNADGLLNYYLLMDNQDSALYKTEQQLLFNDLCQRNPDIKFLYSSDMGFFSENAFTNDYPDVKNSFQNWLDANKAVETSVKGGSIEIKNVSEFFEKNQIIAILFSHKNSIKNTVELACVGFDVQDLNDMCIGSTNNSFVITKDGEVLIHEDPEYIKKVTNLSDLRIVKSIFETERTGQAKDQSSFTDEDGNKWIYTYSKIIGGMFVVTSISEAVVFQTLRHIAVEIIFIAFAVFFIAIIIIHFYSKTLTNPISDLVDATNQIDHGEYELELAPRTRDEIGFLTGSFMNMADGLQERQRLMSTFTKFVNKDIAQKAANGELSLGGEDKNATVFFSDIRSFTAMSEKMTAPEVVEFLNDYFTRMVDCVNKTNGIVDKFIGDAVMAVWGAATTNGSPEADAWAAVKAALMMRIALYHFNQNQIKNGKKPVKIGCGINSGPIVAGQIGSNDHMNYTVIGDTVNLASRTESLNKPFATDILLTENTYLLVKDKVIVEEMPGVHVKGKTDAIKMYAVINAVGVKGPSDIHKLREFLGWDEPDLGAVNTDEEEKKYKIGK